jgi:hypothetical protein
MENKTTPPCRKCRYCLPDDNEEGWSCFDYDVPMPLENIEDSNTYCPSFEYRGTRCDPVE